MDDFKRLHYRVEEDISWSELMGIGLVALVVLTIGIQAIWAPMAMTTFLSVITFLVFLFIVIYQRCLERIRALVQAIAFVDAEERNKLLMLEDEE
jgi:hypothetical protein